MEYNVKFWGNYHEYQLQNNLDILYDVYFLPHSFDKKDYHLQSKEELEKKDFYLHSYCNLLLELEKGTFYEVKYKLESIEKWRP